MKLNLNSVFFSLALFFNTFLIAQNNLNILESSLEWKGEKITGSSHNGSLQFQAGNVIVKDGDIKSGSFTVDMTSLECDDLSGKSKTNLEGHLKSDDFFSVNKFKTASLVITSIESTTAKGFLTIKDITHPINFTLIKTNSGFIAALTFNRSKYDVKYSSGSFYENLGDKLILDDIKISATIKIK